MVSSSRARSSLPLVQNSENIVHVSDAVSQPAIELCDEFYDTLDRVFYIK